MLIGPLWPDFRGGCPSRLIQEEVLRQQEDCVRLERRDQEF